MMLIELVIILSSLDTKYDMNKINLSLFSDNDQYELLARRRMEKISKMSRNPESNAILSLKTAATEANRVKPPTNKK